MKKVSVVGFEGLYSVTDSGVVTNDRTGKQVTGTVYSRGYTMMTLSNKGKVSRKFLHLVVAEAFIGKRPSGLQVDHIDGNKQNNAVSNLRYLSPYDNRMATVNRNAHAKGENNGQSKLKEWQIAEILEAKRTKGRFYGRNDFAELYGVHPVTIQKVANGTYWKDCAAAIRGLK